METLRHPMLSMFGLFIAWKLFGVAFPAIQLFAVNLLYPGYDYR